MEKMKFCRICRTKENLKFTVKQLREFNKQQLALAQGGKDSGNDKASIKLLRTTPTLGNICNDCNERIQIFHRLDDGNQSNESDIEIDVVSSEYAPQLPPANLLLALQNNARPDTPVVVDDNDMSYNSIMAQIDQQYLQSNLRQPVIQLPKNDTPPQTQQQQFESNFDSLNTPPQSNVGSESEYVKVIEILTSRESTPASLDRNADPPTMGHTLCPPHVTDEKGRRILSIIDLDDEDQTTTESNKSEYVEDLDLLSPSPRSSETSLLNFIVASAKQQTPLVTDSKTDPSENNETVTKCENADDDDVIVFRRVDPLKESGPSKKRKRKCYENMQIRVLECVSLVSSDSEPEDTSAMKALAKDTVPKSPKTIESTSPKSIDSMSAKNIDSTSPKNIDSTSPKTIDSTSPKTNESNSCKQCKINFADAESLKVHNEIHKGFKCPVCNFGYAKEEGLLHHMRYKHRTYTGPDLEEKPRVAKDSAMTIRLRFMRRKTFYECQICGRLDEIYKEHRGHIIEKHPAESKSLKDPIMKELKCPVCKCKCGTQYITLCRHLIGSHAYSEYKSHLREVEQVSAPGWNYEKQKESFKSARILQFSKKNVYYIECKLCKKVVVGCQNYLKHSVEHKKATPPTVIKSKPSNENQNVNKTQISSSIVRSPTSKVSTKTKKDIAEKEAVFKIPKIVNTQKSHKPVEITKTFKGKRKSADEDQTTQPQLKKVILTPNKHIIIRSYKCNYCAKKLKSFTAYNLHLLQEHKFDELQKCFKCNKTFTADKNHSSECKFVTAAACGSQKRKYVKPKDCTGEKRKRSTAVIKPKVPKNKKKVNKEKEDLPVVDNSITPRWLTDLYNIKSYKKNICSIESTHGVNCNDNQNEKNNSLSANCDLSVTTQLHQRTFQCPCCTHLFRSNSETQQHLLQNHSTDDQVLIEYKPLF